jgi:hypothetical protein
LRAHGDNLAEVKLMKSDMAADAAEQDGEDPKGEPSRDQIPSRGDIEGGKHEQDKSEDEQDN